jgi:hypothetical protein
MRYTPLTSMREALLENAATDRDKFVSYRNTLVCSLQIQIP